MSSPSSTSSSELRDLRAFTLRVLAFTALLTCVGVAASTAYSAVLWRTDHAFRLEAALHGRELGAPKLLVLGDSHPRCAVLSDELEDAFVYAIDGESLLLTAAKLEAYLETGARPACVLLPADLHGLDERLLRHVRNHRYWATHVGFLELVGERRDLGLARRWVPARWATWLGRGDRIFEDLAAVSWGDVPPLRGPSPVALSFAERTEQERSQNVSDRLRRQFGSGDPAHPDMVAALSRIVGACRGAGVPLVLVRYPVTAAYRDAIPQPRRARIDAVYDRLAAREGLPLVDMRDWAPSDLSLYRDADHLSVDGALPFTRELRERLAELGVLSDD